MKQLWTYIDNKKWTAQTKYDVTLLILGVTFALSGLCAWLLVKNWVLSTWDWGVCFVGYPVITSWFVVFFYSCRHDYHDGYRSKNI